MSEQKVIIQSWTGVHKKTLLALEGNVAFFNNGIFEANLLRFLEETAILSFKALEL